jgi:hypothetical protein
MKKTSKKVSMIISEKVDEAFLQESKTINVGELVEINGKKIHYGSKEYVKELQKIVSGLTDIRNLYSKGSSTRHVYSNACQRLNGLIKKLSSNHQEDIQTQ